MAKKKDDFPDGDLPRRFEIIPQVSVLKINRERDRRVQSATSVSTFLSVALLISVGFMVYQAVRPVNYLYVAQDIRTAAFTELKPLTDAEKLKQAKMAKRPGYNEQVDVQRLEEELAERASMLKLFDPLPPEAAPSAQAASSPVVSASAPPAVSAPSQAGASAPITAQTAGAR